MEVLSVQDLCKRYPGFSLEQISISVRPGSIMGFIGRNGAGKSTTLRSMLNLVHPDSGVIRFFGQEFSVSEDEIKQRLGFVSGGVGYYPKKKLQAIAAVTRRFYSNWDEEAYRRFLSLFQLPENKTPEQLSEGMKVKYALTLALSHHAELLILDEPTSGLDPVSREEILDIFLDLVRTEQISILFSTHITSDLEKCADDITYIQKGSLMFTGRLEEFQRGYRLARFDSEEISGETRKVLIGCKREKHGWSALVPANQPPLPGAVFSEADLDSLMVHLEHESSSGKGWSEA